MEKNNTFHWLEFLILINEDQRLNVWHIALVVAIIKLAYIQNEETIIHASRSKIMFYSHIRNISTYHKYFKELQDFGYIKYTPSYHPGYRSILEWLDIEEIKEILESIKNTDSLPNTSF